jgi:hypothetical protein
MTTKSTPGPWRYDYEIGYCGEVIAAGGASVCSFDEEPTPDDARLIAAAPELLEALKRVMPFIDCIAAVTREEIIEYETAMKMADAAIKKATGQ